MPTPLPASVVVPSWSSCYRERTLSAGTPWRRSDHSGLSAAVEMTPLPLRTQNLPEQLGGTSLGSALAEARMPQSTDMTRQQLYVWPWSVGDFAIGERYNVLANDQEIPLFAGDYVQEIIRGALPRQHPVMELDNDDGEGIDPFGVSAE